MHLRRHHILLAIILLAPYQIFATATSNNNNHHPIQTSKSTSSFKMNKDIRELIHKESRGYDIDSPDNIPKRPDYLSWDDYFLAVAYLSAQRSKDPHPSKKSDGACIVDTLGRIVGIGYDGFPRGCPDDCLPWASNSSSTATDNGIATEEEIAWLHTREPYLCMAEINAILNKCSSDVVGGRMFVGNFPSNECAKFIIQAGIKELIYVRDDDPDSDSSRASRILFEVSGVKMRKIQPSTNSIKINFGVVASAADEKKSDEPTNNNGKQNEDEMEQYLGLLQREADIDPFKFQVKKRSDYLTWDEYFMGIAFLSAQRSKDPNTQVGACIVDENKCIIGIGYNGFPRGCSDAVLPWARHGSCDLHKKYPYGELNKC